MLEHFRAEVTPGVERHRLEEMVRSQACEQEPAKEIHLEL